ncbi:MAG: hypothetical protein NT141_03260 [candidate division WWE3 bacterium]|nr:hypothetical protein [candidate division WWE3 bacterium]
MNFYDFGNWLLIIFIITAPLVYFLLILKEFKKDIFENWYIFIGFLGLVGFLMRKLLLNGMAIAQADANHLNLPFFQYFGKTILQFREPPIWNTLFEGGFDIFAHPLSPYFSPTILL